MSNFEKYHIMNLAYQTQKCQSE